MKTIRYGSQGENVYFLVQMLINSGYNLQASNYFGKGVDLAVKDFQLKNSLVVDGIVGQKTWSKIIAANNDIFQYNNKFLSEKDLIDFANQLGLELAVVKAVNEVESSGKGFLTNGRSKILFEGHVFWRELAKRGIDPKALLNDNIKDVLYKTWERKYYKGGAAEYDRLEKAARISTLPGVKEAAYCSASWGAFQIMGYHYKMLGYISIDDFVEKMNRNERDHLEAFGKFISVVSFRGKSLVEWLKEKNWANFAHGYNGSGYKQNRYDEKLKSAYNKYSL